MTVKRLIEHHLEFLSLKGGCTGSSESRIQNSAINQENRVGKMERSYGRKI